MLDLLFSFKQDEEEQILNKDEEERFKPFEIVINFQKKKILFEQHISNPSIISFTIQIFTRTR